MSWILAQPYTVKFRLGVSKQQNYHGIKSCIQYFLSFFTFHQRCRHNDLPLRRRWVLGCGGCRRRPGWLDAPTVLTPPAEAADIDWQSRYQPHSNRCGPRSRPHLRWQSRQPHGAHCHMRSLELGRTPLNIIQYHKSLWTTITVA